MHERNRNRGIRESVKGGKKGEHEKGIEEREKERKTKRCEREGENNEFMVHSSGEVTLRSQKCTSITQTQRLEKVKHVTTERRG